MSGEPVVAKSPLAFEARQESSGGRAGWLVWREEWKQAATSGKVSEQIPFGMICTGMKVQVNGECSRSEWSRQRGVISLELVGILLGAYVRPDHRHLPVTAGEGSRRMRRSTPVEAHLKRDHDQWMLFSENNDECRSYRKQDWQDIYTLRKGTSPSVISAIRMIGIRYQNCRPDRDHA